jgi:hypothetical protein
MTVDQVLALIIRYCVRNNICYDRMDTITYNGRINRLITGHGTNNIGIIITNINNTKYLHDIVYKTSHKTYVPFTVLIASSRQEILNELLN